MRTIGDSLRTQPASRPIVDDTDDSLTALTEGVLVRVRAERDQSFPSRIREMFTDRRFLWPALGATSAVLLCVAAAVSVLHASISRTPESLAAMITAIGTPGSLQRPLRPADNGISIPRLMEDEAFRTGLALESIPEDDVIYAVRTVVGSDGNVAWEMLLTDDGLASSQQDAVLSAVRKTRFTPAQTPMGQAVAVDVVWLLAKTTAVARAPVEPPMPAVMRAKQAPKPPAPQPATSPLSSQPAEPAPSATA
jgi:hypothetical protein